MGKEFLGSNEVKKSKHKSWWRTESGKAERRRGRGKTNREHFILMNKNMGMNLDSASKYKLWKLNKKKDKTWQ